MREQESIEERYGNYLKGKRVALVGPSSAGEKSNKGNEIDSFDVVVRLNRSFKINKPKDVGERTDILYHCFLFTDFTPDDPFRWMDYGIKFIASTVPNNFFYLNKQFISKIKNTPIKWIDYYNFGQLESKVIGHPNSGSVAIYDLLQYEIKELHIFFLDFHRVLYHSDYYKGTDFENLNREEFNKAVEWSHHDSDSQYMWFKNEIYGKDPRVKVQDYFKEILEDPKYDRMF